MMSLKSRRELLACVLLRYKQAQKSEKGRILDEFVQSTGYVRKYAIFVLGDETALSARSESSRTRRRTYGPDVAQSLLALWRFSDGLCAKRLVPFLPSLIDALERHNEIVLCPGVREKLLSLCISTAERLLGDARRRLERGLNTTLPGTLLRRQIPIRTYEDWTEGKPGFMEIDLVAHCGGTAAGDFAYTLTMTDVFTGWTECVAVANRGQISVQAGIEIGRKRLPFALLGIDSDNGSEFINHHLKKYCDDHKITFTRCRPYKKNDQCHVEQKNGAVVRPLVGYARYEGTEAVAHLNKIYKVHRLSLNYFEPSMKLTSKSRVGSHVKKTYDTAKTPSERYMNTLVAIDAAGSLVNEAVKEKKEKMRQFFLALNPAKLRRDLADLDAKLGQFAVKSSQTVPVLEEKGESNDKDA